MDYLTLFFVASPVLNAVILVLLLIHVILTEQHHRRIEELEQRRIEQSPRYMRKGTPTRDTPVPVNNEIV